MRAADSLRLWRRRLLLAGLAAGLALDVPAPAVAATAHEARATLETTPSEAGSDSVDDMAIWVDPADPSRSLVIGADHGDHTVDVYDLGGTRLQSVSGGNANNVDLRDGFPFGGGTVPLVSVVGSGKFRFYRIDTAARRLEPVSDDTDYPGAHGTCMYRSPRSGKFYAFIVDRGGVVAQFELAEQGGEVVPTLVREVATQPRPRADTGGNDYLEGCAADDRGAGVFVAEQDWHIWRYGAEPGDTDQRDMIDREEDEDGHFTRDVEGMTVVHDGGDGYLIASSQGDDSFNVYRSTAPYTFLRKVRVVAGPAADGCQRTDGIDAVAADLGPDFPRGLFVCQDNANTAPAPGNQNYKYVPLEVVLPLADGPAPPPDDQQPPAGPEPPARPKPPPGDPSPSPAPSGSAGTVAQGGSGYWMLGRDGSVYAFGDAPHLGNAGPGAVDIEPTRSGKGYWTLDAAGQVRPFGEAADLGSLPAGRLTAGEAVTSLSATPTGAGYWLFTDRGRVVPVGDARHLGDMSGTGLNAPVLDSVATPSGLGYYMVAADGGIFSFGDARFSGSMGGRPLNAPVESLVPDPDGTGYWLVAVDGGVFAFDAAFRGSMGDRRLNAPVTGMVANGAGYLMVAADGGIFNFSDRPFSGSLGNNPPAHAIVFAATLDS